MAIRPTKKQEVPEFLDRMEALLAAPVDDPKALVKALRGVTMASIYIGGLSENADFKSTIINAVDICTAYAQHCIIDQDPDTYGPIVRGWMEQVGNAALKMLPN